MGYGRLTEKKIRYIVRHKQRGKSNRENRIRDEGQRFNGQESMVILAYA